MHLMVPRSAYRKQPKKNLKAKKKLLKQTGVIKKKKASSKMLADPESLTNIIEGTIEQLQGQLEKVHQAGKEQVKKNSEIEKSKGQFKKQVEQWENKVFGGQMAREVAVAVPGGNNEQIMAIYELVTKYNEEMEQRIRLKQ